MTSGVRYAESGETGYKVEMGLDSFVIVRECGEEEEPRMFVLSGASHGHTSTDTGRGTMVWQPQTQIVTGKRHPSVWPFNMFYGPVLAQEHKEWVLLAWSSPGLMLCCSKSLTWLDSYCLCSGVWLNWMLEIRVYINTWGGCLAPHKSPYLIVLTSQLQENYMCVGVCALPFVSVFITIT